MIEDLAVSLRPTVSVMSLASASKIVYKSASASGMSRWSPETWCACFSEVELLSLFNRLMKNIDSWGECYSHGIMHGEALGEGW